MEEFSPTEALDQLELKVEQLRRDAVRIVEERDSLLSSLNSIKNFELPSNISECDKDDIQKHAERILARFMTFEVTVRTERNESQKVALDEVHMYINQLLLLLSQDDRSDAQRRCQTYINACTSHPDPSTGSVNGFESSILGCTLDDQKSVMKLLQDLLNNFANETTCS